MISTSFLSGPIVWTPCDEPLPTHPHMKRILDGLSEGLSFEEAALGKFTADSFARLQKAIEKRSPWRSPTAPRFNPLVKPIFQQRLDAHYSRVYAADKKSFNQLLTDINHVPLTKENCDEIGSLKYRDGASNDWSCGNSAFLRFHTLKPYVTKVYQRVSAEKNFRHADELMSDIEKRLSLSGSAGLGTLMLTDNEENLNEFAKKTSSYLSHLLYGDCAKPVVISYVKNKRKGIICSCEFPSEGALNVIKDYLGYAASDVAQKCDPDGGYGLEPFINRIKSSDFVLRRFRSIKRLVLADFLREFGFVNRARETFVGDVLISDRKYQKQRNNDLLNNMVVYDVNDTDNFHFLADLVAKSTNNIDNRFYELLARFKGFAEYAAEFDYQGAMFTLTTPSRFHAFSPNGHVNQKWLKADKPTAQDGANWLAHHWALIQARLAKEGIKLFGFKVCEPHHDGTIHYHIAAWFKESQQKTIIDTFRNVMLLEKESGALKHRFNYLLADKEKGAHGMIGYFLPYIAKNTNGNKLNGHDELPSDLNTKHSPVDRVDAWKCAYRFRQFSQFGGPSVTAWREMRRIRSEFNKESSMFKHLTQAEWFALESVRAAADAGDWKQFCIAMGGVHVKRKNQTVSIKYETPKAFEKVLERLDKQFTEDFKKTRYGDMAKARVAGLNFPYVRKLMQADGDGFVLKQTMFGLFVKTRQTEWAVTDKAHFEKWKSRSLEFVSDQFEQLILSGDYQTMDEELYSQYLDLVDQENSVFYREIHLSTDGIPSDWVPVFDNYLDSPVGEEILFPLWATTDDVQGAALN